MKVPRVLHINVRLSEGGAAQVALSLHRDVAKNGMESRFAYGYSKRIKESPLAKSEPNVFMIGERDQVLANFALFRLAGVESSCINLGAFARIEPHIKWADIVHLHAIHSYFCNPLELVGTIARLGKPIVFTAHDHWLVTGRCALTERCDGWKTGCGTCLSRTNYPPSLLDFSSVGAIKKRRAISDVAGQLTVVSPSKHLALDIESVFPDLKVRVVPNGITSEIAVSLEAVAAVPRLPHPKRQTLVLVIANDLSYPGKTNHELVRRISDIPSVDVIAVGINSPFDGTRVRSLGRVSDRRQLASLMYDADVLLFSSNVDNFPLVMLESLSAGTPVLATPSAASDEILGMVGMRSFVLDTKSGAFESEFLSALNSVRLVDRTILRRKALAEFSPAAMVQRYMSIYKDLAQ